MGKNVRYYYIGILEVVEGSASVKLCTGFDPSGNPVFDGNFAPKRFGYNEMATVRELEQKGYRAFVIYANAPIGFTDLPIRQDRNIEDDAAPLYSAENGQILGAVMGAGKWGKWLLQNEDSDIYVRHMPDGTYEAIGMVQIQRHDGVYSVQKRRIDVRGMLIDNETRVKVSLAETHGMTLRQVYENYPEKAMYVLMESLFMYDERSYMPIYSGSKEACAEYIKAFVNGRLWEDKRCYRGCCDFTKTK